MNRFENLEKTLANQSYRTNSIEFKTVSSVETLSKANKIKIFRRN